MMLRTWRVGVQPGLAAKRCDAAIKGRLNRTRPISPPYSSPASLTVDRADCTGMARRGATTSDRDRAAAVERPEPEEPGGHWATRDNEPNPRRTPRVGTGLARGSGRTERRGDVEMDPYPEGGRGWCLQPVACFRMMVSSLSGEGFASSSSTHRTVTTPQSRCRNSAPQGRGTCGDYHPVGTSTGRGTVMVTDRSSFPRRWSAWLRRSARRRRGG